MSESQENAMKFIEVKIIEKNTDVLMHINAGNIEALVPAIWRTLKVTEIVMTSGKVLVTRSTVEHLLKNIHASSCHHVVD